ncbi:hypothetical protein GQX74_012331 [Glossina fuscipes]|nr:hypothetical protein GQX74_012331 [Glossina fuscipes]
MTTGYCNKEEIIEKVPLISCERTKKFFQNNFTLNAFISDNAYSINIANGQGKIVYGNDKVAVAVVAVAVALVVVVVVAVVVTVAVAVVSLVLNNLIGLAFEAYDNAFIDYIEDTVKINHFKNTSAGFPQKVL